VLADYEVAERQLELEIRRQYPDLQIGPGFGREDGEDRLLFGFSLPLPLLNRNRAGIATASAQRDVAQAVFHASLEQLASETEIARIRLDAARAERHLLEEEVVPMVDQQYADARKVAELGEVDVFVLLESLVRQLEAKLQLIDAQLAESLAAVRLVNLIGPEPITPAAPAEETTP
jgi:outer membrane protein TolC